MDPDASSRALLEGALSRAGYTPMAAASAGEALRLIGPGRPLPAVVVVEAELDGENGFALCGRLRSEPRTSGLPVILLSRRSDGGLRSAATEARATDFLPRPIFLKDIVALVRLETGPRASSGAIELNSAALPIPHLLRGLLAGTRSGEIQLSSRRARLSFRRGKVIDAAFDELRGFDALMRVLLLAEGDYEVALGAPAAPPAFSYGLRQLVSEAFPRLFRWQTLVARSIPLDAMLQVDFSELAKALSRLPDGVNQVLRLFDGTRSVRDVLIDSTVGEVLSLEVATRLYAMGILVPAAEESSRSASLPPLFEPEPLAAKAAHDELFGSALPKEQPPPLPCPGDWFEEVEPALSGEPTAGAEGWAAMPLSHLEPELAFQLEAFNVRPLVEAPEPSHLSEELAAFARGVEAPKDDSIDRALRQPIALTQVWAPEAALDSSAEEAFFAEAPSPAKPRGWVPVAAAVAGVTLLAGALAAIAWPAGTPEAAPAPLRLELEPVEIAAPAPEPAAEPLAQSDSDLSVGLALYESGQPQEAVMVLEQVVEARPELVDAWTLLGLSRYDAGDTRGAEAAAKQALSLDPKNGRAILLRASIYLESGQKEQAHSELRRFLEIEPKGPLADEARLLLEGR